MNTVTPKSPTTVALAAATLLTLTLTAPAAHAVPVSMTLEELPPGLAITAMVFRSTCPNGGQHARQFAASFPLAESSRVVFESATGLDGRPTLRSKVVTIYSGQLAEVSAAVPAQNRCSFGEALSFDAGLLGAGANGQQAQRVLERLGSAANPTVARNLVRKINGSSSGLLPARDLSRNQLVSFTISHENPFGDAFTQAPVMEFSRPGPIIGGGLQLALVTRLFINTAGARCIRAAGVTRCSNNTPLQNGRLIHGGVELVVANTRHQNFQSSFQFELNNDFVAGSYSVRAFADDNDTIDYLVDGVPTELDLIKWVPSTSTMTVL
jgi:hypothetical protein